MSKVVARLEVKQDTPDVDLDDVLETGKTTLPPDAQIADSTIEDVAFGVQKLVVDIVIPDGEGGADAVQSKFEDIDGVQSVEVANVSRV